MDPLNGDSFGTRVLIREVSIYLFIYLFWGGGGGGGNCFLGQAATITKIFVSLFKAGRGGGGGGGGGRGIR